MGPGGLADSGAIRMAPARVSAGRVVVMLSGVLAGSLIGLAAVTRAQDRAGGGALFGVALVMAMVVASALGAVADALSPFDQLPSFSVVWPDPEPQVSPGRLGPVMFFFTAVFSYLLTRFVPAAGLVLGIAGGGCIPLFVWRGLRARRYERHTGWRPVAVRGERPRRFRSYAGDDLLIPGLWWRVTLAAPLAEIDVDRLPPVPRWGVLLATGHPDEALVAARQAHAEDPRHALLVVIAALAAGRRAEAEQWLRRLAALETPPPIDERAERMLAPLHGTDAWRALRPRPAG
jgi:hypothetical protein